MKHGSAQACTHPHSNAHSRDPHTCKHTDAPVPDLPASMHASTQTRRCADTQTRKHAHTNTQLAHSHAHAQHTRTTHTHTRTHTHTHKTTNTTDTTKRNTRNKTNKHHSTHQRTPVNMTHIKADKRGQTRKPGLGAQPEPRKEKRSATRTNKQKQKKKGFKARAGTLTCKHTSPQTCKHDMQTCKQASHRKSCKRKT